VTLPYDRSEPAHPEYRGSQESGLPESRRLTHAEEAQAAELGATGVHPLDLDRVYAPPRREPLNADYAWGLITGALIVAVYAYRHELAVLVNRLLP
jgi:hypothetical protein